MIKPPLNIIVFGDTADDDVSTYTRTLQDAMYGFSEKGYITTHDDTGIPVEIVTPSTGQNADINGYLRDFRHSLVIVLITFSLVERGGMEWFWNHLRNCYEENARDKTRCTILPVLVDERSRSKFGFRDPKPDNALFMRCQFVETFKFGESAIRTAVFTLHALHRCRLLLACDLGETMDNPKVLQFFISHAKVDGLPLALSLKHLIEDTLRFRNFYDAISIDPSDDWEAALENGVKSSVFIMLRTDNYDKRPWCRQEITWCDEYARPGVYVDARIGVGYPPGNQLYENYPVVKIPDGNLLRILFAAMLEDLRQLIEKSRAEQLFHDGILAGKIARHVFGCKPGNNALIRACKDLSGVSRRRKVIIYPDNSMNDGEEKVARAIVASYAPGTELVTPGSLLTQAH
jgi:hypothetical protein